MSEEAEGIDVVSLIDEGGTERRFRLHDAVDLEGCTYYLVEAADDSDLVLVLKEVSGGLETVDEEEFATVMAMLESEG
ncbi:MAG: DUF1292 domain-containing protein [Candidatus Dormibacteraeota bacterium]|nr:DUF1292 domain-containing protein [Candidatus Dormibacteraeota bacterium]